ncbi:MAG: cation:proton antiporter [Cyanobacteriota/Melainabacteria group bacterium]
MGAILATTDPAAVVAIFQKLDVDEKTIYLMEGESLINDGIAVASLSSARSGSYKRLSCQLRQLTRLR